MFNDVIALVKAEKTVDEYGDTVATFTERMVFAELKSIGQKEFYEAQALGLKPEIKFVIADFLDYQGEQIIRYVPYSFAQAEEYKIIRTYRNGNALELICEKGVIE